MDLCLIGEMEVRVADCIGAAVWRFGGKDE